MPEIEDIELRLRAAEMEAVRRDGEVKRFTEDMADLKKQMAEVVAAAAKFGHVDTLAGSVRAAHSRLDEFQKVFMPMASEHNSCQSAKAAERAAETEQDRRITLLEYKMTGQTAAAAEKTGWWRELTMHLAKTFIPVVIGTGLVMWALHFNGVSLQNQSSNADSERLKNLELGIAEVMKERGLPPMHLSPEVRSPQTSGP